MEINFPEALRQLGPDAAFTLANEARPASAYLFNTLLPEMPKASYTVDSGDMTIRPTMAGLVGMDSPYPPGGATAISSFLEQAAKLALEVPLNEMTLRKIQEMLMRLAMAGGNTVEALQREALNFLNKVIIQAQTDRAEWLRGQALVTGAIDWTFNGINLSVDYGVPSAHFLTHRTSNDAYAGSASKFWTDWRAAHSLLRGNVRAAIAHPDTIDEIVNNTVNAALLEAQSEGGAFTIRRLLTIDGNTVPSSDVRDRVTLIGYGLEGEVFDPSNRGQTIVVPFMPRGKILFVANNTRTGYRVGEGATDDPANDLALGYHHIAPTVEGGGRPGRWAELYTPQNAPWSLHGRCASNELPVIEAPSKIVVASTAMS